MTRSSTPQWVADVLASCPPMLTYADVANVLRCSPRTVSRLIADGRLVAVRTVPGGSSRVTVPRAELRKYLSSLGAA